MTAVTARPGRAAGTRRQLPLLIGHQFHADLRCYRRNTQSVFFTLLMPVLFLVILASIFRNATVKVPGGTIKESVYYVPGLIAYGLIIAAFSNLALSVVRNRESGIYKRRRATPLPASAVIAARAAVAVLTALAITAVMLVIGWAAYGASIPAAPRPPSSWTSSSARPPSAASASPRPPSSATSTRSSPSSGSPSCRCASSPASSSPPPRCPPGWPTSATSSPSTPWPPPCWPPTTRYTAGSGLNWGYLAILAAWGAAGLIVAVRRFSWLPRGG